MNRQDVEKTITEYLKPVFGFAMKKCKSIEDAEDLSQEIVLRAYQALLVKDDITDMGKFIWTVAHNALSNYYRDTARSMMNVSVDEVAELIADPNSEIEIDENAESVHRLQKEIAYLSKLQRRIVIAYYYENRKQAEIAGELGIPVGTVKWHLFEAKKELKRGLDMVRKTSELQFNPIRFRSYGIQGSMGTKSLEEFFRSALSQNICYCVRNTTKTISEIADDLGVSPVYVETEVEYLEQYGFLRVQKGRYIAGFIINEPTAELLTMQNTMYAHAAELVANDLYEELMVSGILKDPGIQCAQTDPNYLLWSLIPYIAASSDTEPVDPKISFEEVATLRPDGAYNIFHASVVPDAMALPEDYADIKEWCGPMWNLDGHQMMWQMDAEWSDRAQRNVSEEQHRTIALFNEEKEHVLPQKDYAWLAERGYIKGEREQDGQWKTAWQIVVLRDEGIRDTLLSIGRRLKAKYRQEFEMMKAPYAEAALKDIPEHLKKVKAYELQSIFREDGYFSMYCIHTLLQNGKLKEPTAEQRKSLMTLMIHV